MPAAKTQTLDAGHLRVEFVRQADRWMHAIGILQNGNFIRLLESVEGKPDDVWPVSPPLQELHFEQRPGMRVALLVGHGERNHWAASVEANAEENLLRFDVAARVPDAGALGLFCSSYRSVVGPPSVGDYKSNVAKFHDCTWIVGSDQLRIDSRERTRLNNDGDGGVVIEPCDYEMDLPMTVRWQYTFRSKRG
jgi:hypothetical protein